MYVNKTEATGMERYIMEGLFLPTSLSFRPYSNRGQQDSGGSRDPPLDPTGTPA
jgi:hypothetical protein